MHYKASFKNMAHFLLFVKNNRKCMLPHRIRFKGDY